MTRLDAYYVLEEDDGWWIYHQRGRGRSDRYGPYPHRAEADRIVLEVNSMLRDAESAVRRRLGVA